MKVVKRAKKWTFSKGVSPWILSKNRTFSYRCVSQKLCQKRSFLDILNRKQSFLDQKILKKNFLFAFFTEILSENNVFDILERKE